MASQSIDIPTGIGPRGNTLTLSVDKTGVWAGLYSGRSRHSIGTCVAFGGRHVQRHGDRPEARIYSGALIVGSHFPMSTTALQRAHAWLVAQGVDVDIEDDDAQQLGITTPAAPATVAQTEAAH